jgi:hypothetical protein
METDHLKIFQKSMDLLARTPAVLNSLLRDLPESWTVHNEGPNTWNVLDVVGHLINCERTDWMPRAKTLLQFGESQAFGPFDRFGHVQKIIGKSLPQLLDEFSLVRDENLAQLREMNLQEKDLCLRGTHPAFGPVTLSQLLTTWAVHDLNHLHQISRIMAHQYRAAVGPWSDYLGVHQCAGHGAP